jgi:DNA-binding LytR/AlgR family response regulator
MKVAIIEDEALASERLKKMVQAYDPELKL